MIKRIALTSGLLLFLIAPAAVRGARPATAPATTRAAGEVEVVVAKVEPGATLVTGKLDNVSPSDLFFKLAQHAKVGIVASDEGVWDDPALQTATFSAEWEKQPLWEAVNEACEATGLKPSVETPNSGRPRIKLERGPVRSPAVVDGPVLIRPQRIVRSACVSYANGKQEDDLVRLTLAVLLEPKLRKNAWIGAAQIERAVDENGMKLPSPGDANAGDGYGQPSIATLSYPAKAGNKIAVIRGKVPLLIVSEMATITFHDPFSTPRELTTKIGPHKLTLKPVSGDMKNGWNVHLRLDRGDQRGPASDTRWKATAHPLGSFGAYIAMIGPKGETLMNGGSGGSSDTDSNTQISFPAREAGDEPTALRVEVPVSFETKDATFEFKDLPLP